MSAGEDTCAFSGAGLMYTYMNVSSNEVFPTILKSHNGKVIAGWGSKSDDVNRFLRHSMYFL